jgi:thymidylate kinase
MSPLALTPGKPRAVTARTVRIAVGGIDGAGKSTLCGRLEQWAIARGCAARVVGNLPRAYRRTHHGVVDPSDPFVSSFFFNHAVEHADDPGSARFMFDARYVDYVMALEEARLYQATMTATADVDLIIHDRHVLDRRVHAYRAGCPRADIDTILGYVPPPDLTILLDLPAHVAVDRVRLRGRPGREENVEDLAEYRELYRSTAAAEPGVVLVDATAHADEVFTTVVPHLAGVLEVGGHVRARE